MARSASRAGSSRALVVTVHLQVELERRDIGVGSKPMSVPCAGEQSASEQRPATSRIIDSASWPPTRMLPSARRSPSGAGRVPLSVSTRSGRDADHAGTRPNSTAVASDASAANASTVRSIGKSKSRGRGSRWSRTRKAPARPTGHQDAERAAQRCEHQPFAEELPEEPAASRAERRPDGELAAACRHARASGWRRSRTR